MEYCKFCGKEIEPKIGPRIVLEHGDWIWSDKVYKLKRLEHYGEYVTKVMHYYFVHSKFCPKCNKLIGETSMNDKISEKDIASKGDIIRYFKYCQKQGINYEDFYLFPGDEY